MQKPNTSKLVSGGSVITALGAISFAVSQMYAANQETARLQIEMDAKATCESQQIEDSDYCIVLHEGIGQLAMRLEECLKK